MKAQSVDETAQAESGLNRSLADLRAVAEQYPDLKATENFQQLSRNLSELEDEIQASRRIYNSNVQAYNTKIQQFPASVVANQGGFTAKEFFEIEDAAERATPTSASEGHGMGVPRQPGALRALIMSHWGPHPAPFRPGGDPMSHLRPPGVRGRRGVGKREVARRLRSGSGRPRSGRLARAGWTGSSFRSSAPGPSASASRVQ